MLLMRWLTLIEAVAGGHLATHAHLNVHQERLLVLRCSLCAGARCRLQRLFASVNRQVGWKQSMPYFAWDHSVLR